MTYSRNHYVDSKSDNLDLASQSLRHCGKLGRVSTFPDLYGIPSGFPGFFWWAPGVWGFPRILAFSTYPGFTQVPSNRTDPPGTPLSPLSVWVLLPLIMSSSSPAFLQNPTTHLSPTPPGCANPKTFWKHSEAASLTIHRNFFPIKRIWLEIGDFGLILIYIIAEAWNRFSIKIIIENAFPPGSAVTLRFWKWTNCRTFPRAHKEFQQCWHSAAEKDPLKLFGKYWAFDGMQGRCEFRRVCGFQRSNFGYFVYRVRNLNGFYAFRHIFWIEKISNMKKLANLRKTFFFFF